MSRFDLSLLNAAGAAPSAALIPLPEMREFARVTGTDQDGELQNALAAAVDFAEGSHGYLLGLWRRQWIWSLPCFPSGMDAVDLRMGPVASVDAIQYIAPDDSSHVTLTADKYYLAQPGLAVPKESWPSVELETTSPVKVTFTAGYADPDADDPVAALPYSLRQAVKILALAFWEDRSGDAMVPKQADAIFRTFGAGAYG